MLNAFLVLGAEEGVSHAGVANLLRVHGAVSKRRRASMDMASALDRYTKSYVRIKKMEIELAKKHHEADMKMQWKIARSREDMTERVIKMRNDAMRSMSSQPERVAAFLANVIPSAQDYFNRSRHPQSVQLRSLKLLIGQSHLSHLTCKYEILYTIPCIALEPLHP